MHSNICIIILHKCVCNTQLWGGTSWIGVLGIVPGEGTWERTSDQGGREIDQKHFTFVGDWKHKHLTAILISCGNRGPCFLSPWLSLGMEDASSVSSLGMPLASMVISLSHICSEYTLWSCIRISGFFVWKVLLGLEIPLPGSLFHVTIHSLTPGLGVFGFLFQGPSALLTCLGSPCRNVSINWNLLSPTPGWQYAPPLWC